MLNIIIVGSITSDADIMAVVGAVEDILADAANARCEGITIVYNKEIQKMHILKCLLRRGRVITYQEREAEGGDVDFVLENYKQHKRNYVCYVHSATTARLEWETLEELAQDLHCSFKDIVVSV